MLLVLLGTFFPLTAQDQVPAGSGSGAARRTASSPRKAGIATSQTVPSDRPLLRQQEPTGWVWVTQTFDISKQIGQEETILTLDGEPLPSLLRRRVTLGLVLDNEGHIVTRLIDISPSNPPTDLSVRSLTTKPVPARFLGIDLVSGLCILETDGTGLKPALDYSPTPLPAALEIRLYGFHPNQRMNLGANIVYTNPRRNFFAGKVVKAIRDFRYQPKHPIYHLVTPQLTPVQDGSLVLGPQNAIFGMSLYDSTGQGPHLVYPITRIRDLASSIIESKQSLTHGWLGATGVDARVGPPSAIHRPSLDDVGVRITAVAPDSPAEKCGMVPKDLLIGINERRISNYAQLVTAIRQLPAGSEISVRVRRGNEVRILKPVLVEAPSIEPEAQLLAFARRLEEMETRLRGIEEEDGRYAPLAGRIEMMRQFLAAVTMPAPPSIRLQVFLGIETVPLTGQLMRFFSVTNGLLVTSVEAKSKAALAGLQAGDVLVRAGTTPIADLPSLLQSLYQVNGEDVPLLIVRHREEKTILLGGLLP